MSKIGVDDYKFGRKNNWRRRVWNDISRRVKNKKSAKVLYLASDQDLDRTVAIEKGFSSHNMFIIESDPAKVKKLRSENKPVIEGDLFEVLMSWKPENKIDVLHLDLCCGLTMKVANFLTFQSKSSAFSDAIVMVNMLRGRDPQANEFRRQYERDMHRIEIARNYDPQEAADLLGEEGPMSMDIVTAFLMTCGYTPNLKHRGMLAFLLLGRETFIDVLDEVPNAYDGWHSLNITSMRQVSDSFWLAFQKTCAAEIYSYKTSKGYTRMDSIVFENYRTYTPEYTNSNWDRWREYLKYTNLKPQIAAVRATNTRRMNNQLQ